MVGAGIFGLGMMAGALIPGAGLADGTTATDRPPVPQVAGQVEMLGVLLAGVSDADPVVCELALMALDGRSFGWSDVRADVEGAAPGGIRARDLAGWVMRPPRHPALVPPLRDALVGPDPCAARTAARLLGRMRTDEALDVLRTTLRHPDALARRGAALALGFSERPEAAPDLRRALEDADSGVRAAAAWGLGEVEDRASVTALARTLSADRDPVVRKAAAWALGRIG
jgi:HEAT repeat protein